MNNVKLSGKIVEIINDYSLHKNGIDENSDYNKMILEIVRPSNNVDLLPIVIKKSLFTDRDLNVNDYITGTGSVNMINIYDEDNKSHSLIYSYITDINKIEKEDYDELDEKNVVNVTGRLCRQPNFRVTPSNKIISDMILAVNKNKKGKNLRTDFLPVIAWGKDAHLANESFGKGDIINVSGRFHSRNYFKENVKHTVYEISITNVNEHKKYSANAERMFNNE